jgi:hypothetical protein
MKAKHGSPIEICEIDTSAEIIEEAKRKRQRQRQRLQSTESAVHLIGTTHSRLSERLNVSKCQFTKQFSIPFHSIPFAIIGLFVMALCPSNSLNHRIWLAVREILLIEDLKGEEEEGKDGKEGKAQSHAAVRLLISKYGGSEMIARSKLNDLNSTNGLL